MNQALTAIVEQAASTLGAPAQIVNARGTVLASSPGSAYAFARAHDSDALRIRAPLAGYDDSWMVIELGLVVDQTMTARCASRRPILICSRGS